MSAHLSDLLAFGLTGSPWLLVVAWLLGMTQLTIHSVSLYLHRSATHRGVDFHPALAHAFRFWTWLTTGMVTKEWVAIHRKHHARCETDGDPHSPVVHGIGTILWHGVALYQDACKDRAMVARYGIGTVDDWIERNLYARWSSLGPTLMLFIDLALFGAVGLVVWALQMLWIPVIAAGVINGLGHWWGYRNFETADRATNLVPWGIVIGGEELHNNHHAFPSSAKFALRKWEFDSGWALLRLFEAVGLAKVIRIAPSLAVRPNIALPDADTVRAVLAHRFHVMTSYYRLVLRPALEQERRAAGESMDRLTRRLRRALANDGRWLDEVARARLGAWVAERPSMQVLVEHRRRLGAAMERSGRNSQAMLESLQAWCTDAERSGIATLEQFARTLRGYALAPARA